MKCMSLHVFAVVQYLDLINSKRFPGVALIEMLELRNRSKFVIAIQPVMPLAPIQSIAWNRIHKIKRGRRRLERRSTSINIPCHPHVGSIRLGSLFGVPVFQTLSVSEDSSGKQIESNQQGNWGWVNQSVGKRRSRSE